MEHRCRPIEDIAALAARPADDPQRIEAAACPRCDALMAAAAAFLAGDPDLPAGELDAANARLGAFVAGGFGAERTTGGGAGGRSSAARGPDRQRPRRRTWGLAFATAMAAVLVVALMPHGDPRPSGRLRGGEPHAPTVVGLTVTAGAGFIDLAWDAFEGADGYRVALFDAAFAPAAGARATDETHLRVATVDLPAGDAALYVQVEALSGTEVLARSAPRLLPR
ncbi:MAG TPA: hypothetical protein PLQ13_04095 [Candidatus Krumholzibacteria bacterium]|nr:hypothetical protein [Candidatus Krumholzibacteria bacterium]